MGQNLVHNEASVDGMLTRRVGEELKVEARSRLVCLVKSDVKIEVLPNLHGSDYIVL